MRKKVNHPHDGKSIKTFLIYAAVVGIVILVSLGIRAFLIFQQSKYTGQHFTLAFAQNERVKEIVVFDPEDSSMSLLHLSDESIAAVELPRKLGISPDGFISTKDTADDVITENVSDTLFKLGLQYPSLKTNLTFFDIGRLSFYAKNLPPNKITIKAVDTNDLEDNPQLERILVAFFSDDIVATENISIQIVNASGISGMAQRLEKVLLHKGANVVSLSSAPRTQAHSQIKYFGDPTYTLDKIKKMLAFPESKLDKETIANIIIILGEDSKNTQMF